MLLLVLVSGRCGGGQEATHSQTAESAATLAYIHSGWDELSRSMTDCHSLVDVKVTTTPVLYVPADFTVPAEVRGLTASCGVRVVVLPKRITKLGDLMPEELAANKMPSGLLYLPNKYVVPGGRFNVWMG